MASRKRKACSDLKARVRFSSVIEDASDDASPASALVTIYCDGSCTGNGSTAAAAGIGVVVYRDGVETWAHSAPLSADEVHSNQRAELRALEVALKFWSDNRASACAACAAPGLAPHATHAPSLVVSDSLYALQCASTWGRKWRADGWLRGPRREPICHLDVIKRLVPAVEEAQNDQRYPLQFVHVRGHKSDGMHAAGNNRADELARSGSAAAAAASKRGL